MNDWGFEGELEWLAPPVPNIPRVQYADLPAGLLGHKELGIIIQRRYRVECQWLAGEIYYHSGHVEYLHGHSVRDKPDDYEYKREGLYVNGVYYPDWDK